MDDDAFGQILMWGTVHLLAKEGKFDDIRPDVLVQQYSHIRLLYTDGNIKNGELLSNLYG